MRRRHSLGDTNGLGEGSVAQLPLHGVAHDQVDLGVEDLLEPALDPEEVEEADGLVQVDEQVDVASRAGVPARRSESLEGLPRVVGPSQGSRPTGAKAGPAPRHTHGTGAGELTCWVSFGPFEA
jgi:hypothetical protein